MPERITKSEWSTRPEQPQMLAWGLFCFWHEINVQSLCFDHSLPPWTASRTQKKTKTRHCFCAKCLCISGSNHHCHSPSSSVYFYIRSHRVCIFSYIGRAFVRRCHRHFTSLCKLYSAVVHSVQVEFRAQLCLLTSRRSLFFRFIAQCLHWQIINVQVIII